MTGFWIWVANTDHVGGCYEHLELPLASVTGVAFRGKRAHLHSHCVQDSTELETSNMQQNKSGRRVDA